MSIKELCEKQYVFFLEIQFGYCDEDDIVRLEDKYGRGRDE